MKCICCSLPTTGQATSAIMGTRIFYKVLAHPVTLTIIASYCMTTALDSIVNKICITVYVYLHNLVSDEFLYMWLTLSGYCMFMTMSGN